VATMRRAVFFGFVVFMLFTFLRLIANRVTPSEARDLPQRAASNKQNLSNTSPNVRSFAVSAAQDDA
jgi:hypothetical protein